MDETMSKKWKGAQEILQSSLKQEIGAMREMLANMHQEELSLLAKDRKAWTQVMLERVGLLTRLSELRSTRLEVTHMLESLSNQISKSLKEEDCEILSMRDQLAALVEKMNQQNLRIHTLEANDGKGLASSYPHQAPHGTTSSKDGPRAILATYPRPK